MASSLTKTLYIKLYLIFVFFGLIFSNNLISLYLKKDAATNKIIDDLNSTQIFSNKNNSQNFTLINEYALSARSEDFNDELKVKNLSLNFFEFNSVGLHSKIISDSNLISLISSPGSNNFKLKLNLDYSYQITFANGTSSQQNGSSWISLFSANLNYSQAYLTLNYEISHFLDFNLILSDMGDFFNTDLRVVYLLHDIFNSTKILSDIVINSNNLILKWIINYYLSDNINKYSLVSLHEKNQNFTISTAIAENPQINNSSIINFYEGSILETPGFTIIDSQIEKFTDFNLIGKLINSDFQLFVHKKIFFNLFKLDRDQKTFTIEDIDLEAYNVPEFNDLSINWISKFYPSILNTKSRSEKFHIEYTYKSIIWDDTESEARVMLNFFFLNKGEVILEFKMSYIITLQFYKGQNLDGVNGINCSIDNDNMSFNNFKIVTSPIGRFDKNGFSRTMQNLINSIFKDSYIILKEDLSFPGLIKNFNEIENLQEGVVLGYVPEVVNTNKVFTNEKKNNLKFLQ